MLGLCNDHFAYVADASEHDQATYESRSTLFGRDTAENVQDAVDAALEAAGFMPPPANGK